MKSGLMVFAAGIIGLAGVAAMVVPAGPGAAPASASAEPAKAAHAQATPVTPAPMPGGMVSNSRPTEAVTISGSLPQPPIVATPRIPGPADMMVASGSGGEVRTIRSFPSNEACAAALPVTRRTISNAFCVSTTPPPPEPEAIALTEISAEGELVSLKIFESTAECERARSALPAGNGRRSQCGKFEMH